MNNEIKPDPNGFNLYTTDDNGEHARLVATARTLGEAQRRAREVRADQIQEGLDGKVWLA